MSKQILITGGNGFIGRHLIKYLLRDSEVDNIHIVDNLCNSQLPASDPLRKEKKLTFFIQSVADFQPITKYTEIYHFASPVGPAGVLNYAGKMAPMIISDTAKIAHMAIGMRARMIDISTSEVYGKDPGNIPQKENIEKIVPSDITVRLEYGVAKLASEVFLINLIEHSSLEANIIRPFNIVGIGQKGEVGFVLPRFVQQALAGENLTVFGDGKQERTFTSVYDLIEGILLIQRSDIRGEIFNLGNPNNRSSIWDLAERVIKLSDSSSVPVYTDPTSIYGKYYREAWNKIPDITKVQTFFSWLPSRNLEEIVREVIGVEQNG